MADNRHDPASGRPRRRISQDGQEPGVNPLQPPRPSPAPAQSEAPLDDLAGLLNGAAPRRNIPPPGQPASLFDEAPASRYTAPAAPDSQNLSDLAALVDGNDAPVPLNVPQPRTENRQSPASRQAKKDKQALQKEKACAKKEAWETQKNLPRAARTRGEGAEAELKKGWLRRRITPKRVVLTFVGLFVFAVLFAGFFFVYTTRNDNLWMDLETIPYRTETVLYASDSNGRTSQYAVIPCTQHKEYVSGDQIPQHVKDAFVAIEDKKFYDHWGFDFKRTVFAVANEMVYKVTGSYIGGEDGRKQGASTITQQLVKNLTRDDEGSNMAGYMRKARELCRAVRLDALYSKEEILDAYLNTISFTGNTAGVQTEAKKLFGKTVDQLTIAEGASLAAITNSPGRYSPVAHPEAHLERRNYVIYEMHDQGYITTTEYDAAVAEPLNLNYNGEVTLAKYVNTWFTDTVISTAVSDLVDRYNLSRTEASNLIYNGGLRIYTTVDPVLQKTMEEVYATTALHPRPATTVTKQLTGEDGQPMVDDAGKPVMGEVQVTPQAAMVSLTYDGGIAGIAGGLGEKTVNRPFNRATSAYRQVGSTIKPIGPYATALEDGWITWSSAFPDEPVSTIKNAAGEEIDWPANADNTYLERDILVREGIARSVNTTAVQIGRQSGNRRMYSFLHEDLGVTSLVRQDANIAPLALGATTYGISPLEMAAAYAMFGNGGYAVTPHCYTTIESGTGIVLITADTAQKRVISEETAFIMNRLLMEVVNGGTAAGMWVPGEMESSGKTGTTSDKRDHWFVGLTPYYVTASWYGYDDNLPLEAGTGQSHPPTVAWRAVMQTAQQGLPAKSFPGTERAVQAQYCTTSGCKAGPNCPTATGWYKWYQQPGGTCPVH